MIPQYNVSFATRWSNRTMKFDYKSSFVFYGVDQLIGAFIGSGVLQGDYHPDSGWNPCLGDIFVGRVAGNFVNENLLGSMEFACKVSGSKLVLVMGHQHCGAVKGAIDN